MAAQKRSASRRVRWIGLAIVLQILGWCVTRYTLELLGKNALRGDDAERALQRFRAARVLAPWSAELAFATAVAARRAGQPDRFLEYAELARRHGCAEVRIAWERELLDAQSGQLHYASGFAQGRSIESHLRQIVQRGEDEAAAREALSKGLIQSFRLTEAERELKDWIERFPGSFQARLWLAEVLTRRRAHRDAVEVLQEALTIRPESAQARLKLAHALHANGRAADAIALLEKCRKDATAAAETYTLMARCLIDQGELPRAREFVLQAHRLAPQNPLNLALLAQIELSDGTPESAVRWAQQAVQAGPREQIPNYVLAQALERTGRTAEATVVRQRVAEIRQDWNDFDDAQMQALSQPLNPAPRLTIGLILARNLDPHQGIRWILSALAIDPNHQPSHEALAELYVQSGDTVRAEQHRERSRQLDAAPN